MFSCFYYKIKKRLFNENESEDCLFGVILLFLLLRPSWTKPLPFGNVLQIKKLISLLEMKQQQQHTIQSYIHSIDFF